MSGPLEGEQCYTVAMPHFDVTLNIPHAATIASRIEYHVGRLCAAGTDTLSEDAQQALESRASALARLLEPYASASDNPPTSLARSLVEQGAALARELVDEIEQAAIGNDRLGQAVRNLFECFELGEEGVGISLRAGEDPNSLLRPI